MKTTLLLLACVYLCHLTVNAGTLTDKVEGDLVKLTDGKVKKVPKGSLAGKKILAFYYSAHWCPPCRAFTPILSQEYRTLIKDHPEFELILVSSDRNELAMEEYMAWGKMDFPALDFRKKDRVKVLEKLAAQGIPYLVVTDADGNELAGRGSEDWVHPQTVLPKLKELLKK